MITLQPASFASYPPQARQLAIQHLPLLRRMPAAFVPLLLREVINVDWKFPAERTELDNQFRYLESLAPTDFEAEMHPFTQLQLAPALAESDWVNTPAQFGENLSAHLWATHQIEAFSRASVGYVHRINQKFPPPLPPIPRLTLVALGRDAKDNRYPLFRKLRRHGTYFANIDGRDGRALFSETVAIRARTHPDPYSHWHVDGAGRVTAASDISSLSFVALQNARDRLIGKMRAMMAPGAAGPEALRTMMAQMTPADLGLANGGPQGLLNRFQISILTEGSGTQLFSTTFVQWSAREILRRAQPLTLLLSYAPRQREQSMQEQISGQPYRPQPDPAGSLIDADMGTYYTWLNMNRLSGAAQAHLIGWFEEGTEAIACGPSFKSNLEDKASLTLRDILNRISA